MWRTTGDVEWRDRGYKLSRNMYVQDLVIRRFVESTGLLDDMPRIFDDTNSFKLDEWVCSTEAQSLPST